MLQHLTSLDSFKAKSAISLDVDALRLVKTQLFLYHRGTFAILDSSTPDQFVVADSDMVVYCLQLDYLIASIDHVNALDIDVIEHFPDEFMRSLHHKLAFAPEWTLVSHVASVIHPCFSASLTELVLALRTLLRVQQYHKANLTAQVGKLGWKQGGYYLVGGDLNGTQVLHF